MMTAMLMASKTSWQARCDSPLPLQKIKFGIQGSFTFTKILAKSHIKLSLK
jgi:hypothetical protein